MYNQNDIPKFVSVVAFTLGCFDLIRGFLHTAMLLYSSVHFAGLDLSTPQASDLLRLLGAFGVSNYITGAMLILVALKARELALIMLAIIPMSYFIGMLSIRLSSVDFIKTHAKWDGLPFMLAYNIICLVVFITGVLVVYARHKKHHNLT